VLGDVPLGRAQELAGDVEDIVRIAGFEAGGEEVFLWDLGELCLSLSLGYRLPCGSHVVMVWKLRIPWREETDAALMRLVGGVAGCGSTIRGCEPWEVIPIVSQTKPISSVGLKRLIPSRVLLALSRWEVLMIEKRNISRGARKDGTYRLYTP
jgi:hypothetical protein